MESVKFVGTRTVDELGRIVLPHEIRKKCDWKEADALAIYCIGDNAVLLQCVENHLDSEDKKNPPTPAQV